MTETCQGDCENCPVSDDCPDSPYFVDPMEDEEMEDDSWEDYL